MVLPKLPHTVGLQGFSDDNVRAAPWHPGVAVLRPHPHWDRGPRSASSIRARPPDAARDFVLIGRRCAAARALINFQPSHTTSTATPNGPPSSKRLADRTATCRVRAGLVQLPRLGLYLVPREAVTTCTVVILDGRQLPIRYTATRRASQRTRIVRRRRARLIAAPSTGGAMRSPRDTWTTSTAAEKSAEEC